MVIENRPSGDGMFAIQAFLSAHDVCSGGLAADRARVSNTISAVAAPASMNIATMADWVAQAPARPGKRNGTGVPAFTEFVFEYL